MFTFAKQTLSQTVSESRMNLRNYLALDKRLTLEYCYEMSRKIWLKTIHILLWGEGGLASVNAIYVPFPQHFQVANDRG